MALRRSVSGVKGAREITTEVKAALSHAAAVALLLDLNPGDQGLSMMATRSAFKLTLACHEVKLEGIGGH